MSLFLLFSHPIISHRHPPLRGNPGLATMARTEKQPGVRCFAAISCLFLRNTNVPNVTLRSSKVVWRDPPSCTLSQEFAVVNLTISIYVSVRRISHVAQNHNI